MKTDTEKIEELYQQNKELTDQVTKMSHDINSLRQEYKNYSIIIAQEHKAMAAIQDSGAAKQDIRIERLITLLEGDPADRGRGLISRVIDIERFTATVRDTKAYLMGNIAAAVFIITLVGAVLAALWKVYDFLSHK